MRYRWQLGFWAFLLMRISGAALALYLAMHLYVLHNLLKGPETFDAVMKTVQNPVFKFFELVLLGGVLYHSVNGVRILFVDFGQASKAHEKWFWGMVSLGVVILIIGAIPFLKHF